MPDAAITMDHARERERERERYIHRKPPEQRVVVYQKQGLPGFGDPGRREIDKIGKLAYFRGPLIF